MTVRALLERAVEQRGDAVALRYKEKGHWHTRSYHQLMARVRQVSEILTTANVKPGDRVALYRENSPEWPEIYFGIVSIGAVAVPIDAKLQEQEVAHILRDSGSRVIFTSAKNYAVIRQIETHLTQLDRVILIGGHEVLPVKDDRLVFEDYDASMALVADKAASDDRVFDKLKPRPDDLASLIYTSGTTGRQKAAMLSHGNFAANTESCLKAIDVKEWDNFMLVLPLHHSFAFMANLLVPIGAGCEISLVESLKTIGENMAEAKPTVLCAVPLLLEKMYGKIQAGLRKKKLAYLMLKCGLGRVVGKKIIDKLGGRLRALITGGAPCDPAILHGWQELGISVLEGYGLTESAPVLTFNPEAKPKPGTVGKAVPGVELKLIDPNEQGVGEIAARGANVMQGYYNNPEATNQVIQDGWLLTGDLGLFDEEGYLTISGRKKSLIVNREGKNIYPEEVEHQALQSPSILEALCMGYRAAGETAGERVGLIVVPDQEAIDDDAARHGKKMNESEIQALMQSEVKRVCKSIAEYKRPRCVQVRFEAFDKTSTQKVKRYLYAIDTIRVHDNGCKS